MPFETFLSDGTTDQPRDIALERNLLREFLKERAGFQFAVAIIDDDQERDALIGDLTARLAEGGVTLRTVDLRRMPDDVVLLDAIRDALAATGDGPAAIGVVGVERHMDVGSGGGRRQATSLLADANFQRDAFPRLCPVPLVLWMTSLALPAIARVAPDLWHWRAATFDLCDDSPDTPWADHLDRLVPRTVENWQAQPKEELHRRIHLLRQLLVEIGSDGKERRARLLIELADATERVGDYPASMTAAREAMGIATTMEDQALRAHAQGRLAGVLSKIGAIDEALALHTEQVEIYETLGDERARAVALGDIARLKAGRGEVAEALRLHEEALSVYESLGDVRSRAVTLGDIARLKADRGEVAEALRLHEEALSVYESFGDVRSRAVRLGDIARLKADRGEVAEALRLHEEKLSICESLGDVRSRAVTLVDIARLKADRGEVAEALRLHEEALSVYKSLGDVRSRAVTLGGIACLKADRGEVAEALSLHEEALSVYESLGDVRSRALTLVDIARLKAGRGEVAEALRLHEEALSVYESLGDVRSRAVTLGDIARLKAGRGEVAEALHLHEERLAIFEALGDRDGQANARWLMAMLRLDGLKPNGGGDRQVALADLVFAYSTLDELGQADGIAVVGLDLAQIRAREGAVDEARALAERSRALFARLEQPHSQAQAQAFLDGLPAKDGSKGG